MASVFFPPPKATLLWNSRFPVSATAGGEEGTGDELIAIVNMAPRNAQCRRVCPAMPKATARSPSK